MRYSASEKFEIIRLVEQSNLSVCQTLLRLGIRKSTFYNWLKRYQLDGIEGLEDRKPRLGLVWNKLPAQEQAAIIKLALEKPELSPRELAVTYIDEQSSFVSESSVQPIFSCRQETSFSIQRRGLMKCGKPILPILQ